MPSSACPNCGEVYYTDKDACAVRCVRCGTIIVISSALPACTVKPAVFPKPKAPQARKARVNGKALSFLFSVFPVMYATSIVYATSPFSGPVMIFICELIVIAVAIGGGAYGADALSSLPVFKRCPSIKLDSLFAGIGVFVAWILWIRLCSVMFGLTAVAETLTATSSALYSTSSVAFILFLGLTIPSAAIWLTQGSRRLKIGCLAAMWLLVCISILVTLTSSSAYSRTAQF